MSNIGRSQKCSKCGGFQERVVISQPHEYFDLLKQVKELLAERTMIYSTGTCPLDEIQEGKPWPDDFISHVFQCASCGLEFELSVETYHGSGGSWNVRKNVPGTE